MEKSVDSENQAERELSLRREIQTLRLSLAEKESAIQRLSNELERTRFGSSDRAQEMASQRIEKAIAEAARPADGVDVYAHVIASRTDGTCLHG